VGRNKPNVKEYSALLNIIVFRKKGKCKIYSSIFVNKEILDDRVMNRSNVRRNLILHLLDEIKNPGVMYRKPNVDYLKNIFGPKDAAIVFECITKNMDYLITRDNKFVSKAKEKLKYNKPLILTPIDANEIFKKTLKGYVDYFNYLE